MIATQLKELINQLGLSQRQFALKIDLDPGYLSRILQGKATPPARILILIENVFNVNRKWLEFGTGETFTNQGVPFVKKQVLAIIDTLDERQLEALKAFLTYLKNETDAKKEST